MYSPTKVVSVDERFDKRVSSFFKSSNSKDKLADIVRFKPLFPKGYGSFICTTKLLILVSIGTEQLLYIFRRSRVEPEREPESVAAAEPVRPLSPRVLAKISAPPSLRDLTGSGYRFPPRLRRFLEARDRTCVFPGCGRPARKTDKDHRRPWPAGPTSADNGECLCRHHHRAKHAIFTVQHDPGTGDYLWISRGGWTFRRHPKGY